MIGCLDFDLDGYSMIGLVFLWKYSFVLVSDIERIFGELFFVL